MIQLKVWFFACSLVALFGLAFAVAGVTPEEAAPVELEAKAAPVELEAKAAPVELEAKATPVELETLGESETSPFDIFNDLTKVVSDWRKLGWIAGLIALINMLINLLRFKPINEFLEEKDLKWCKPLAACVLGGCLGGLTTYQTGVPWLNSVAAGVLTALGSVGFHELISTLLARTTKKYKAPQPV